jgi:hypothetical protein
MNFLSFFLIAVLLGCLLVYLIAYFLLEDRLRTEEGAVIALFLAKISKIPALIEVMRPSVANATAFDAIVALHSEAMIRRYDALYDLLEQNARIEHEFSFLMRLSMQIPTLQKAEYFLYIRDFIMQYERDMRSHFTRVNTAILHWNRFILIKKMTGIGWILPGKEKMSIR